MSSFRRTTRSAKANIPYIPLQSSDRNPPRRKKQDTSSSGSKKTSTPSQSANAAESLMLPENTGMGTQDCGSGTELSRNNSPHTNQHQTSVTSRSEVRLPSNPVDKAQTPALQKSSDTSIISILSPKQTQPTRPRPRPRGAASVIGDAFFVSNRATQPGPLLLAPALKNVQSSRSDDTHRSAALNSPSSAETRETLVSSNGFVIQRKIKPTTPLQSSPRVLRQVISRDPTPGFDDYNDTQHSSDELDADVDRDENFGGSVHRDMRDTGLADDEAGEADDEDDQGVEEEEFVDEEDNTVDEDQAPDDEDQADQGVSGEGPEDENPNDILESEPSGSDFDETEAVRRRIRAYKASIRRSITPTMEEQDLQDELDFEREINLSPPRIPASQKGKARARTHSPSNRGPEISEPELSGNSSDEIDEVPDRAYSAGPIPQDVKDAAYEAHATFISTLEELARSCNKPVKHLLRLVGQKTRRSRKTSVWGAYEQWFSVECKDKLEGVPRKMWSKIVSAEYNKELDALKSKLGVEKPTRKQLEEHFKEQVKFARQVVKKFVDDRIEAKRFDTVMAQAIEPFIQQSINAFESFGIHFFGFAIFTSASTTYSRWWGGTPVFETLLAVKKPIFDSTLRDIECLFKTIEMQDRLEQGSILKAYFDTRRNEKEIPRDYYRRMLESFFRSDLERILAERKAAGQALTAFGAKMDWQGWTNHAYTHELTLINWAVDVSFPGNSSFKAKSMITESLKSMAKPRLEWYKKQVDKYASNDPSEHSQDPDSSDPFGTFTQIISWSKEDHQKVLKDKHSVPLVTDMNGKTLLSVADCDLYIKSLAKSGYTLSDIRDSDASADMGPEISDEATLNIIHEQPGQRHQSQLNSNPGPSTKQKKNHRSRLQVNTASDHFLPARQHPKTSNTQSIRAKRTRYVNFDSSQSDSEHSISHDSAAAEFNHDSRSTPSVITPAPANVRHVASAGATPASSTPVSVMPVSAQGDQTAARPPQVGPSRVPNQVQTGITVHRNQEAPEIGPSRIPNQVQTGITVHHNQEAPENNHVPSAANSVPPTNATIYTPTFAPAIAPVIPGVIPGNVNYAVNQNNQHSQSFYAQPHGLQSNVQVPHMHPPTYYQNTGAMGGYQYPSRPMSGQDISNHPQYYNTLQGTQEAQRMDLGNSAQPARAREGVLYEDDHRGTKRRRANIEDQNLVPAPTHIPNALAPTHIPNASIHGAPVLHSSLPNQGSYYGYYPFPYPQFPPQPAGQQPHSGPPPPPTQYGSMHIHPDVGGTGPSH